MVSACSKNESVLKRIRSDKANLNSIGYFVLACAVFCICASILLGLSLNTVSRFFIVQVFFVYIPGFTLSVWLFRQMSPVLRVGISYSFGYVINIVEYYVAYGLFGGAAMLIAVIGVFLAIVALMFAPKKQDEPITCNDAVIIIIFVLYLTICMIAYSSIGTTASAMDSGINLSRDMQFWISNAVGCELGFPPATTYMSGENLYYHYFSSVQIAFLSRLAGVSIFDLAVPLFPFGKSIMLVGGIAFLIACLASKKDHGYYWFFLLLMLFTTGIEDRSIVTYTYHILLNPFGFDVGMALGCFFLGVMIKQWEKHSIDIRLFVSAILLWGGLVGTKGPIAMILLMSVAIFCIYWLSKKQWVCAFSYGLSALILFLIVSVYVAGAFSYVASDSGSPGVSIRYEDQIASGTVLPVIGQICKLVFLAQPVLVVLACVAFVVFVILLIKRDIAQEDTLLSINMLITTIIGFLLGVLLDVGGRSEMYFTMAAYIPCVCFVLSILQAFLKNRRERTLRLAIRWLNVVFVGLLVVGMYFFFFVGFMGNPVINALKDGSDRIVDNIPKLEVSFTSDEAKTANWIKENSTKDSVVATNRSITNGENGAYYFGIFSERQQYMETDDLLLYARNPSAEASTIEEAARRYALIRAAYSGDASALSTLHKEGVDYLICDTRLSAGLLPSSLNELDLVFESGPVQVYQFTQ